LALQGSNTAALRFEEVSSDPAEWISDDAHAFLPRVRPAFLGLQCGLAIGLARASLDQALASAQASRHSEVDDVCDLRRALEDAVSALHQGLASGHFKSAAADLFRLRIHLAELAQEAVSRELTCCGGKAYLQPQGGDFARRWREAAFVPIVTPSLSQLRGQLRSLPSEASKSHLVHRREAA
jgi:alkylation response protein AidB-like acyl-CoA dehydrogenase